MKIIGLIGGLSWESTAIYYREINGLVKGWLGGLHSAKILLWSFDFDEVAALQAAGDWDQAAERMVDAALRLKRAGAECLVICSNTMHKMAEVVEARSGLPVVHIGDATAYAIREAGLNMVGLLGTRFTMEQPFLKERLERMHQIQTLIPTEEARETVHRIIYDELCQGVVKSDSKQRYIEIINALVERGARGVVLGCTEIGMLVSPQDVSVPLFDTTLLHARAAAVFAME